MELSVEELARCTGTSIRTLHHYDEIGLLKPAVRLSGGRRIYGVEEVLRLAEILFLKKTRMNLKKIQALLNLKNGDKIAALSRQKDVLLKELSLLKSAIQSIDERVEYYRGNPMSKEEVIAEFKKLEKAGNKLEKLTEARVGTAKIEAVRKKNKTMTHEELKRLGEQGTELFKQLVKAIDKQVRPNSVKIQSLIRDYLSLSEEFGLSVSKESCLQLKDYFKDLASIYEKMHPKLPQYLSEALEAYAASLSSC